MTKYYLMCISLLSGYATFALSNDYVIYNDKEERAVVDLAVDSGNRLWVAFQQRKLAVLSKNRSFVISNNYIGNDNGFVALEPFRNGMLVGTSNAGLWWMPDAQHCLRLTAETGLLGSTVFDILVLSDNRILAITEFGIFESSDLTEWRSVRPELRRFQPSKMVLFNDKIAIGTYNGCVFILNAKNLTVVNQFNIHHPINDIKWNDLYLFAMTTHGIYIAASNLDSGFARLEYTQPVETRGDVLQSTWASNLALQQNDSRIIYAAFRDRGLYKITIDEKKVVAESISDEPNVLSVTTYGNTLVYGLLTSRVLSAANVSISGDVQRVTPEDIKLKIKKTGFHYKPAANAKNIDTDAVSDAVFLGMDRTTRGNWFEVIPLRYSMNDSAIMCGWNGNHYFFGSFSWERIKSSLRIPPTEGDRVRKWWTGATNDVDALSWPDGSFRVAGYYDDHGEVVPHFKEGPDINFKISVPNGYYILTIYMNCSSPQQMYRVSVGSATAVAPSFNGGTYLSFLVNHRFQETGLKFTVERLKSHNTQVSGVFLTEINSRYAMHALDNASKTSTGDVVKHILSLSNNVASAIAPIEHPDADHSMSNVMYDSDIVERLMGHPFRHVSHWPKQLINALYKEKNSFDKVLSAIVDSVAGPCAIDDRMVADLFKEAALNENSRKSSPRDWLPLFDKIEQNSWSGIYRAAMYGMLEYPEKMFFSDIYTGELRMILLGLRTNYGNAKNWPMLIVKSVEYDRANNNSEEKYEHVYLLTAAEIITSHAVDFWPPPEVSKKVFSHYLNLLSYIYKTSHWLKTKQIISGYAEEIRKHALKQ